MSESALDHALLTVFYLVMQNPNLIITMASGKKIIIELMPELTPNTVASVIWLAGQGLYDGRAFYRVVKDFVIQTGCSKEMDYKTGCDYIIESECAAHGFTARQPLFVKYIVGMAGMGPDTNITSGSEFFIMTGESQRLNGNFPVIGKVISGFEEVDRINNVASSDLTFNGIKYYQPLEKEILEKVTAQTFGVSYQMPKIKPCPEGYRDEEEGINKLRRY